MRILVIDDELLIVKAITAVVARAGHTVVGSAGTLQRALELVDSVEADIALVDMNLSGVSSEPVLNRLTERGTATIVMSGYTDAQLPVAARTQIFLPKPMEPQDLLDAIASVRSSSQA